MLAKILIAMGALSATLPAATPKAVRYDCQSGEYLLVTYQPAPARGRDAQAILEVTGKPRLTLPQVISGSGARYSDGYTVLWNKGNEVTLESGTFNPKGCKERSASGPAPDARTSLLGTWRAVELAGKAVAAERPAFVEFAAENRASGSLGCNRFSGTYQVDGDKLKFGPLAATKMACAGPGMQIETDFSPVLDATASWQLNRDDLTLRDPAGKLLAVLKKE